MKISRMNPFNGIGKTVAFFDVETNEGMNIKGFTTSNSPRLCSQGT